MNHRSSDQFDPARRIVVGIDGSDHAVRAAVWAASLAERRSIPLQLVHVFRPAEPLRLLAGAHRDEYTQIRTKQGEALLDAAREAVLARCPRTWVLGEVVEGDPARILVALSHDAVCVVAGTRGCGGFAGLLLGSVGLRLAAHCHCPAVFVPGALVGASAAATGSVGALVLGVEPDEPDAVLEFAFHAAEDLGANLRMVYAWEPIALRDGYYLVEPALLEAEARAVLRDALKRAPEDRFPTVEVTAAPVRGNPPKVLVAAAHGAPLLVIGAHRARSPLSIGVGSVVHAVLSHAPCPIAVVPAATLHPVG
jgi:nucleotide-binding universal stress UspA family protein